VERKERSKNDKRKEEQGGIRRKFHQRKQEERERGGATVTGWISGIALRIRNMPS
jgi:hypothetical protein